MVSESLYRQAIDEKVQLEAFAGRNPSEDDFVVPGLSVPGQTEINAAY